MFRLDKVLRFRETEEREARAIRADFERRADTMDASADGLRRERDEVPEGDAGAGDNERVRELATWAAYSEGLRRKERSLRKRLGQFRPQVAEKVRIHTEIRKEVEGLRKLRDREYARRRKERERKQQETIDDAAARRKVPQPGTGFRLEAPAQDHRTTTDAPEWPVEYEINPDRGTGR